MGRLTGFGIETKTFLQKDYQPFSLPWLKGSMKSLFGLVLLKKDIQIDAYLKTPNREVSKKLPKHFFCEIKVTRDQFLLSTMIRFT